MHIIVYDEVYNIAVLVHDAYVKSQDSIHLSLICILTTSGI